MSRLDDLPYAGARRGELLNLRWSDVDLDGKQITITGPAGVVDGERKGRPRAARHRDRAPRMLINAYNHPKGGRPPAEPLPYARLHDLRHIHATTLLLAGVPVHVVTARLGHADPAITLRVYAHVVRSAETAAADVFAKAIKAA
ncbi:hypothetical protein GCM10023195_19180 [Actinoallomurus liliacearum]|uniref:Tyr recombinase domain-containing protein n=1 Tax=Actinoallomurus liliacearum TaxID=1080073 RepID=A0ABP8TH02_9ACTN